MLNFPFCEVKRNAVLGCSQMTTYSLDIASVFNLLNGGNNVEDLLSSDNVYGLKNKLNQYSMHGSLSISSTRFWNL